MNHKEEKKDKDKISHKNPKKTSRRTTGTQVFLVFILSFTVQTRMEEGYKDPCSLLSMELELDRRSTLCGSPVLTIVLNQL